MSLRHPGSICIVGGGLAGLSCAVALSDAGQAVTVFESQAWLGGRARSWRHESSGDTVDIGPHVVHSEYRNFLAFLRRLGTHEQIAWQPRKLLTVATARGAYALRHRWLPAPLSLLPDMARAPGLSLRDVISNVRVTRRALEFREEQVAELDRVSGLDLLRSCGTTRRMIDWFWRLASMAVMNVPLERCSAAALMRVHCQLIGHTGVHFGFAAVGLGDLYIDRSVAAIRDRGGTVHMRAEVVSVRRRGGRHVVTLRDGRAHEFDSVVLAVPPASLDALQPGLAPGAAIEPSPYKSVYLWFDRSLTSECFWALLWRADRLNYDFYDLANIRPSLRGRGSIVASNIIYSHRVADWPDDRIVRATLRELCEFAPEAARATVLHADVHDIPMAIAAPLVGTEAQRLPARTSIPALYVAGDWTRTCLPSSMESAVKSGWLAAEAMLADAGRPRSLALPPSPNTPLSRWLGRKAA